MPLLLMLVAGAVTTITVYFRGLGLTTMLIALLAVLLVFYVIGSFIVYMLDSFDKKNEEQAVSDEGEVIEKESDEELKNSEENSEEETESR